MFLLRKIPFAGRRFAKPQSRLSSLKRLKPLGLVGVGAAFIYLFEPSRGNARRKKLLDMTAGRFRRGGRQLERLGRLAGAEAYGVKQKLTHLREEDKEFDDVTLANKVMSEVFSDSDVPKGDINVSAEEGTIVLVGQVQRPEQVNEIEKKVLGVQGVRGVRNQLHLPKTPVPETSGNGRSRRRSS
jgi:osmotically-inducible protein OsmY